MGAKRALDNQEFFTRLGQRLIKALDPITVDGFVFRVDMRLRPYGSSGALVLSFNALEQYYQDQGRDWERYAMIKARVVAGTRPPVRNCWICCGPSSIGATWTSPPSRRCAP